MDADALRRDLAAAVERVAAQRRARLQALLGPGVRNLGERVDALPGGLGDALKGRTRSGWLPAGTVVDGVLQEELTVWYRPGDGRVLASTELVADPPPYVLLTPQDVERQQDEQYLRWRR